MTRTCGSRSWPSRKTASFDRPGLGQVLGALLQRLAPVLPLISRHGRPGQANTALHFALPLSQMILAEEHTKVPTPREMGEVIQRDQV